MKFNRSAGILLHPTSLPGEFGIGDLGPWVMQWLDFLSDTDCGLWQVLPLGPTGYGDSPYQCFSAFAGNPYLISPETLFTDGLLNKTDLEDRPYFPNDSVNFGMVIPWKLQLLHRAFSQYEKSPSATLKQDFERFQEEQVYWLEDFALFMAIKEAHGGGSWVSWSSSLRNREPDVTNKARHKLATEVTRHKFWQYIFFRQWAQVRAYAQTKNIKIIGDIPIFVAHDSAEVWAHPELFYLDDQHKPTVVAGVPPDYFTKTGQLWGNPLYRWDVHASNGYTWWLNRLKAVLQLVDIIRLDHFRGFAGYWEVPASAPTAETGRWVSGPGKGFFTKVINALGDLPIIAEDLGEITPDVVELRDHFGLPGMKILQFAFHGNPQEPFLPHNFTQNCMVYTGTHDNDTSRGWFNRVDEKERNFCRQYLGRYGSDIAWDLIRTAWASVAVYALAPMQDLLNLGNEARMNYPGNPAGNWSWRMPASALNPELQIRLKEFNFLYYRRNQP